MSDVNRTLTSLLLSHTICRHFWRIVVIEVSYILERIFVLLEAQLIAPLIFCFLISNVFADFGFVSTYAPFPILMDKKSFVIMERKGVQMMENKRKKGTPPPRYDDAFKAGAVRMVIEQGRPSAEVAKELGICIDTLRSWLKAAGVQPGQTDRQNRDNRKMRDLEAEVRALRKQLAEKDEVIDILKKSVGILSKP